MSRRRLFALIPLVLPLLATAQKVAQDWFSVTEGDEYYFAVTLNESNSVLGQWCYFSSGNCVYLIGTTTACEGENPYPILANSDAGSQMLQVKCGGAWTDNQGIKRYRYLFTAFDDIDSIVRKANSVGFAMPLQNGRFNVVRFTLNTSNAQIDRMRASALAKMNSRGAKRGLDTHDTTL